MESLRKNAFKDYNFTLSEGKDMEQFSLKRLLNIKDYRGTDIVFAFTALRFIAACLITNTHYNDVYPITSLAVGGLLGDVLFFIVSGFVLARTTKKSFFPWYGKRIVRIYPTVIAGVVLYLLTGYKSLEQNSVFEAFIFPTFFVFVAAIILLYIPYYFVSKVKNREIYLIIGGGILILWIVVYIAFLDRSNYLMNQVTHPMILFPYFFAMLIGGYIRKFGIKKYGFGQKILFGILSFLLCLLYFATNNIVRGSSDFNDIQILVPITLLIAACSTSTFFFLLEDWFRKWPVYLTKTVNFVAALTLEIYVIQRPIIDALCQIGFPVNWVVITAGILCGAVSIRISVNFVKNLTVIFWKKMIKNIL